MIRKLLFGLCIVVTLITCVFLGRAWGVSAERDNQVFGEDAIQSFYGIIESIDQPHNLVLVSGIPENDINHRGRFYLTISKSTKILAEDQNTAIQLDGLKEGDEVRVTYHGLVLETSPAQISVVDVIWKY